MLERFYFDRDGHRLLSDTSKALRRLSRVHYSAGKILLQQRRFERAQEFLSKAIRRKPTYLKVYPLYAICRLGRLLGLSRREAL